MRVLVLDDHVGRAADAERRLRIAGHATPSCTDPITGVPCRAIPGGTCPLDGEGVDAVVFAVEDEDRPLPVGLTCAGRRHVPAVCVTGLNDDVDLVTAVEQVVHLMPPGHGEAALAAVRDVLAAHGRSDVEPSVGVGRDRRRLHIEITTDQSLDAGLRHLAALRAYAALRQRDPLALAITVTVT